MWTVQKEVSRKNSAGKGYGVRAVGTPIINGTFQQKLFRDPSGIPDSGMVNPMNGLF